MNAHKKTLATLTVAMSLIGVSGCGSMAGAIATGIATQAVAGGIGAMVQPNIPASDPIAVHQAAKMLDPVGLGNLWRFRNMGRVYEESLLKKIPAQ
jgi:hypothetical protein